MWQRKQTFFKFEENGSSYSRASEKRLEKEEKEIKGGEEGCYVNEAFDSMTTTMTSNGSDDGDGDSVTALSSSALQLGSRPSACSSVGSTANSAFGLLTCSADDTAAAGEDANCPSAPVGYQSYGRRWLVLLSVLLLNLANYSGWISFAAVTSKAADFYQVKDYKVSLYVFS